MAAATERPVPVTLAPGVTTRADVQGGAPVIAGTRIETIVPVAWWGEGVGWPAILEHYPTLPSEAHWAAAVAFEAGRRYERQQAARDKRRRWVGTIADADAHRAKGYAEGLAAAARYLRDSGRGDWAVVLTTTLGEQGG
jgi:uncharacterized protein (DUF433 family)